MVLIGVVWIIFVSLQSLNQQLDEQIHEDHSGYDATDGSCCGM